MVWVSAPDRCHGLASACIAEPTEQQQYRSSRNRLPEAPSRPEPGYACASADGSFDFIFDKATLDALLTAGAESATRWRGPASAGPTPATDADAVTAAAAAAAATADLGCLAGPSVGPSSTAAAALQGGTVGLVSLQQAKGEDKAAVTDRLGGLDLSVRWEGASCMGNG